MMWYLLPLACALADVSAGEDGSLQTVEVPHALLAFDVPSAFREVTPRHPALFEAVWLERATERMRLVVYVVPEPIDAGPAAVLEAAAGMADDFTRYPMAYEAEDPSASPLLALGETSFVRAALALARDSRHLAFLCYGPADSTGVDVPAVVAARSVGRVVPPYPTEPGRPYADHERGFSLSPPAAFEREPVDFPVLFWARAPSAHGLRAEVAVRLSGADLGEPLEVAAERLRERMLETDGLRAEGPRPARSGGATRFDIGFRLEAEATGVISLVELDRHRIEVTLWCEPGRFEAFSPAFRAVLDSISAIDRRPEAALGSVYVDSEAGFQLRPPTGFERDPRADALVRFREAWTLPPRATLAVLPADAEAPRDLDACIDAAEDLRQRAVAGGLAASGPVRPRLISGQLAAQFDLVHPPDPRGARRIETRTLVAEGGHAFLVSFAVPEPEYDRTRGLLSALLLHFRLGTPVVAPALDEAVTISGWRVRPPLGWPEATPGRFASPDFEGAFLEVGAAPFEPPGLLAGPSEGVRSAVVLDLSSRGHDTVRVLEAELSPEGDGVLVTAFTDAGKAFLEIRRAIPQGDAIRFARGVAPSERFRELRALLEASVRSFGEPEKRG